MEDKEVGELWKRCGPYNEGYPYVVQLIRKLVEERANVKWRCGMPKNDCHKAALRDFGIDSQEAKPDPKKAIAALEELKEAILKLP